MIDAPKELAERIAKKTLDRMQEVLTYPPVMQPLALAAIHIDLRDDILAALSARETTRG